MVAYTFSLSTRPRHPLYYLYIPLLRIPCLLLLLFLSRPVFIVLTTFSRIGMR